MSGMATTGNASQSDYDNRTVLIEVSNLRQSKARTSVYTYKVPYSSMSQTMQHINRLGAKVTSVTVLSGTDTPPAES